jgi:hypothetical protein
MPAAYLQALAGEDEEQPSWGMSYAGAFKE